jgi:penicillin-binding protein 2
MEQSKRLGKGGAPRPHRGRAAWEEMPPGETQVTGGRVWGFALVIFLLLSILVARLWYLQILRGPEFRSQANTNRQMAVRTTAPRGIITDFNGRLLVQNSARYTVFLDPQPLPRDQAERQAVLDRLCDLLALPADDREALLKQALPRSAVRPIPVWENADLHLLSRIEENRLYLPGVYAEVEPVRRYPYGSFAAHVIGHIGPITEKEMADEKNIALGYVATDFIGKDGVEKQYDHLLNGTEGSTRYEVDSKMRRRRVLDVEKPMVGATLRLTLISRVQEAAERMLAGRTGAAVAVDPRTGRILAMASYPGYNPNDFAVRPLSRKKWDAMNDPKTAPLINRAISAAEPPGSTFKIVTSAAGLATGRISPYTHYFCGGALNIGGWRKGCHGAHGSVGLERALAVSCDVFYYQTALSVGMTEFARWGEHFGVGVATEIDLPYAARGRFPTPAWKAVMAPKFGNPDSEWYAGDTANVAIGQGDVLMTPLQVAQLSAAIAGGGVIYKPYVVEEARDTTGKVLYRAKPEVQHRLPLSEQHIRRIAQGLRAVVVSGTSRSAAIPGIAVAGKSGTAEKKDRRRGQDTTLAWFTCYAPYEDPKIAVGVLLYSEKGRANLHGGSDAAPIAREMITAYLKPPTDKAPAAPAGTAPRQMARR